MKLIPTLTNDEIEILRRSREDPNIFTDYFFRPHGASSGWKFDENFDPQGAWQKMFVMMSQKDGRVSGGIGTGKTVTVGMGASWLACVTHPDFKFMNVAPTALQSQWMYDIILKQAAGAPFERLIWSAPARPYPKIEIKFKVFDAVVHSTLFFMSIDKNARNILTFEGDWINIDEAGLIDNLEEVIISLGSRLRGSYRGRERMGRLTLTTNPWDNPYFWYLFDLASSDSVNNLSIVVSTRHNHNVSKEQLERILARIPKSEWQTFIDGARPEGRGNFFSKEAVYACEDEEWGDYIEDLSMKDVEGYEIGKLSGAGVVYFKTPRKKDPERGNVDAPLPIYIILGDPGTGAAPNRNAPSLGVFEVGNFPDERAELVAFWWGDGNGSISPFVYQLASFTQYYRPTFVGIDSTGTQKNMAETLNALIQQRDEDNYVSLFGQKYQWPMGLRVSGLDFSGSKKGTYLVALQFLLEGEMFRWPKFVTGLRGQLTNYDPSKDRTGATSKVPQDLVAMMAEAAYVIRRWFNADIQELGKTVPQNTMEIDRLAYRNLRYGRAGRSRRSRQIVKNEALKDYEVEEEIIPAPDPRRRKKVRARV